MNCTEFNSRDLGFLALTLIVSLHAKQRSTFEILLPTLLEHTVVSLTWLAR
jgi:hypothetical protein